jgi:hypothetical protein
MVGSPKGADASAKNLREFVDDINGSGCVTIAIETYDIRGVVAVALGTHSTAEDLP